MLDGLVFFLIFWVALMPDRLGYDEGGEGGGSRRRITHRRRSGAAARGYCCSPLRNSYSR